MYKIKYNENDELYTVYKYIGSQKQHCISSYNYLRCVEYVSKIELRIGITYVNNSFTD